MLRLEYGGIGIIAPEELLPDWHKIGGTERFPTAIAEEAQLIILRNTADIFFRILLNKTILPEVFDPNCPNFLKDDVYMTARNLCIENSRYSLDISDTPVVFSDNFAKHFKLEGENAVTVSKIRAGHFPDLYLLAGGKMYLFGQQEDPEKLRIALTERRMSQYVLAEARNKLNPAVGCVDKALSLVIEEEGAEFSVVVKETSGEFPGRRSLIDSRDCFLPRSFNPHVIELRKHNRLVEEIRCFIHYEAHGLEIFKVFLARESIHPLDVIDNEHYARPGDFYSIMKDIRPDNAIPALLTFRNHLASAAR